MTHPHTPNCVAKIGGKRAADEKNKEKEIKKSTKVTQDNSYTPRKLRARSLLLATNEITIVARPSARNSFSSLSSLSHTLVFVYTYIQDATHRIRSPFFLFYIYYIYEYVNRLKKKSERFGRSISLVVVYA